MQKSTHTPVPEWISEMCPIDVEIRRCMSQGKMDPRNNNRIKQNREKNPFLPVIIVLPLMCTSIRALLVVYTATTVREPYLH